MLPIYLNSTYCYGGKAISKMWKLCSWHGEGGNNHRSLSKMGKKYLVFEFSVRLFVILSYFGEDAGKAEDRHLERALLSPASSLYASPWSLSALQKGGASPGCCRRSDIVLPSSRSTAADDLAVSFWLLLSTSWLLLLLVNICYTFAPQRCGKL